MCIRHLSLRVTLFLATSLLSFFSLLVGILPNGVAADMVQVRVADPTDDAGRNPFDCVYPGHDNEVYFGKCGDGLITSGFRFPGVLIPRGARVDGAWIEFTVDGPYNEEIHLRLAGEATGDAHPFSGDVFYPGETDGDLPENRALTESGVDWLIPFDDHWEFHEKRRTPDIATIVQEIVCQDDWIEGNALAVIFRTVEVGPGFWLHRRVFAVERVLAGAADPSEVAILIVQYTPTPITMAFDLTPGTLSLASEGLWVTAYLEPPSPFAASTIDVSSIRLNGTVAVDPAAPTALGDHDANGVPDLMVKFNRAGVDLTLAAGDDVPVTVSGVVDCRSFLGTDHIRVRRAVVSAPAGGSHLTAGSVTEVHWETPSEVSVQSVALFYSLDGGSTWSPIGSGLPNTGSYQWTVPNVWTDQAKLVVVLVESADESGATVQGVLGVSEAFTIESVLGVGHRGPSELAIAIRGAMPNLAAGGRLWVEFALGNESPAQLDLIDVAGRVLSSRQVGALGPGTHALDVAEGVALRSGIYYLRLSQGGSEVRTRSVVLR